MGICLFLASSAGNRVNFSVLPIFENWSIGVIVTIGLILIFVSIAMIIIGFTVTIIIRKILKLPFNDVFCVENIISSIILGFSFLLLYSYLINIFIIYYFFHIISFILVIFISLILLLTIFRNKNSDAIYLNLYDLYRFYQKYRSFVLLFFITYPLIMFIYFYHTLSNFILPYYDGWFNHGKGAVIAVSGFYINDPSFFYWFLAEIYQLSQHGTVNVYILTGIFHWIPLAVLLLSLIDLTEGRLSLVIPGFLMSLAGTYMFYYGLIYSITPSFQNMAQYTNQMLLNLGPFASGVLFPSYSSPRTICGVTGLLATIYSFILFLRGSSFYKAINSTILFSAATFLISLGYPPYLIPVATFFPFFLIFTQLFSKYIYEDVKKVLIFNEIQAIEISLSLVFASIRLGIYNPLYLFIELFVIPLLPFLIFHITKMITTHAYIVKYIRNKKIIKILSILFFTTFISIFALSSIFIITPHKSFSWKSYKWSVVSIDILDYNWYVFFSAYAPILVPSFLFTLIIILKILDSDHFSTSFVEIIFTSLLVIYSIFISYIASIGLGLYYSTRAITEWIPATMVYFLPIIFRFLSKYFKQKKIKIVKFVLLILIFLPISGTLSYSYFISTYNPLFNRLNMNDIKLLEEVRQLYSKGNISIVLPLDEDLEYLANYVAAVPTYTVDARKLISSQIKNSRNFSAMILVLEKYQTNALLMWKNDNSLPFLHEYCSSNCSFLASDNLNLVIIHAVKLEERKYRPFVVEHSELWKIKS